MPEKPFVAFYLPQEVWVPTAIEKLEDFGTLHNLLEEFTFSTTRRNFDLKACRDGMFFLHIPVMEAKVRPAGKDFDATVGWWSEFFDYINAFFLILDHALLEREKFAYFEMTQIDKTQVFRASLEDCTVKSMGWGGNTKSASSYFMHRRMFAAQFRDLQEEAGRRLGQSAADSMRDRLNTFLFLGMKFALKEATLDLACDIFDALLTRPYFVKDYAELAKALAEYKRGDYETALILTWFVVEKWLSNDWNDFIISKNRADCGGQRISTGRMESLKSGRDYSASIRSNMLELADMLPCDLYREIDEVRRSRNKVVHTDKNFVCRSSHAQQGLQTALRYLVHKGGADLKLNFSQQSMG
ncbi:MAG: hypothetical protein NT123_12520 [Proteobacteria bacterium]|nr:hypothetical protein [Pseudomonadota bacterium]